MFVANSILERSGRKATIAKVFKRKYGLNNTAIIHQRLGNARRSFVTPKY